MSYKVIGIVDTVFNEETVGNNGFLKRLIWIQTEEQYSQVLQIEFNKANTDLLDGYEPGQKVEVTFNINGRKNNSSQYGERVFNSLVGFQIKRL